jgi:hypothetical protein
MTAMGQKLTFVVAHLYWAPLRSVDNHAAFTRPCRATSDIGMALGARTPRYQVALTGSGKMRRKLGSRRPLSVRRSAQPLRQMRASDVTDIVEVHRLAARAVRSVVSPIKQLGVNSISLKAVSSPSPVVCGRDRTACRERQANGHR